MCGYANGVVKKVGGGFLKIVHEKYRAKHAEDQEELHQRQMEGTCVCRCVCVHACWYVALSKYVCVCMYVCMYVCVCMYTCTYVCVCLYVCIHMCLRMSACASVRLCVCDSSNTSKS